MQDMWVQSLGQKDPLEKEMALVFLPGNSIDRGAWWAASSGVTEESDLT